MPGAPSPLVSLAACAGDLLLEAMEQSHLEHLLEAPPEACGEGLLNGGAVPGEGGPTGMVPPVSSYSCLCRPQAQSCQPGSWSGPPAPGHCP